MRERQTKKPTRPARSRKTEPPTMPPIRAVLSAVRGAGAVTDKAGVDVDEEPEALGVAVADVVSVAALVVDVDTRGAVALTAVVVIALASTTALAEVVVTELASTIGSASDV